MIPAFRLFTFLLQAYTVTKSEKVNIWSSLSGTHITGNRLMFAWSRAPASCTPRSRKDPGRRTAERGRSTPE